MSSDAVSLTTVTDASQNPSNDSANDLPEQLRIRREKRDRILESGRDAYPVEVPRTHTLAEIRAGWIVVNPEESENAAGGDETGVEKKDDALIELAPGEETDTVVGVACRVMFVRNTGKLAFATLQDGDGTALQVMLSLAEVGEEALASWKADVDLGDMVFVLSLIHI